MKFGKVLRRRALVEWQQSYVSYKELKKIIKSLVKQKQDVGMSSAFFMTLAREGDKVDRFYLQQLELIKQQLMPLIDIIYRNKTATSSNDEKAFAKLCDDLDKLRSYVILNHLAFTKILKKFDKKCDQSVRQSVLDCIQLRPFYCSTALAQLLTQAECAAAVLTGNALQEAEYVCPVCIQVLSNPVVLSCAHRFCWHCLAKASLFGQCCPVCRKEQSLDPCDYQVDNTLKQFLERHFPQPIESNNNNNNNNEDMMLVTSTTTTTLIDIDIEMSKNKSLSASASSSEREIEIIDETSCGDEMVLTKKKSFTPIKPQPIPQMHQQQPTKDTIATMALEIMSYRSVPVHPSIDSIDWRTPYLIKSFSALLHYVVPGSFVVLDIDETIVMSPRHSALLLPQGIALFQDHVNQLPIEFAKKVALCQKMQAILDDKVLCEHLTTFVIQELQNRGCWVFGLTSRYSNTAARTNTMLQRLGLNFNLHAVLPSNQALQDPDTHALYSNGVIYTNARDKGDVLNRFLMNVIFRDHLIAGITCSTSTSSTTSSLRPLPSTIYFVDDRFDNASSVACNVPVAHRLCVPIRSFHYVGATEIETPPDFSSLVSVQISTFVNKQEVMSDAEALSLVCGNGVSSSSSSSLSNDNENNICNNVNKCVAQC